MSDTFILKIFNKYVSKCDIIRQMKNGEISVILKWPQCNNVTVFSWKLLNFKIINIQREYGHYCIDYRIKSVSVFVLI